MRIKPDESTEIEETQDEELDPELNSVLEAKGFTALAESPELQRVIRGAMDGTLPLDRPLEVNQPQKLSPRAIQTVLLAIGDYYTKQEIAAISGMNYVYVTKLVKHPYAQRILSIANAAGAADMSCIERRLKEKAPTMLRIIEDIAIDEDVPAPTRVRAAFGWLDKAGYNETQKVKEEKNVNHNIQITHKRSKLIAEAIREANSQETHVEEADFEILESKGGRRAG